MKYLGKEITDFTDQELKEANDEIKYIYNYSIERKRKWVAGKDDSRPKPPNIVNPLFNEVKISIEEEIKKRGLN